MLYPGKDSGYQELIVLTSTKINELNHILTGIITFFRREVKRKNNELELLCPSLFLVSLTLVYRRR